ncbi:hypothetical protein BB561_004632 [Smittium simulii]|uniref:AAA+ ATPase domain-containing protein n=1 Tax=Smittium simulii TaxID=133385 RepID=A0A2T9YF45_9FUNG|nr:hypothetical protein BB561_004632 [Smittium simulii]
MSQKRTRLKFSKDAVESQLSINISTPSKNSGNLLKKHKPSLVFQSRTSQIELEGRDNTTASNPTRRATRNKKIAIESILSCDSADSDFSQKSIAIDILSSDDYECFLSPVSIIKHNLSEKSPTLYKSQKSKTNFQKKSSKSLSLNSKPKLDPSKTCYKNPSNNIDISVVNQGIWWADLIIENRAQLAVHKKKVDQVFDWLDKAINFPNIYKNHRMLVLLGPTGSGKTATLKCLAHELNSEIIEWINPTIDSSNNQKSKTDFNTDSILVSKQFSYFLQQAKRYSSLQFIKTSQSSDITPSFPTNTQISDSKTLKNKIILVEDLPNVGNFQTKLGFLNAIRNFLCLPADSSFPLVLIFSETGSVDQLSAELDFKKNNYTNNRSSISNNFDSDSLSIYNILSKEILDSQYCQKISFNSVANTILQKLLLRTAFDKGTQVVEFNKNPSNSLKSKLHLSNKAESQIKKIAEISMGDIRTGLNNLQLVWPEVIIANTSSCKVSSSNPLPESIENSSATTESNNSQFLSDFEFDELINKNKSSKYKNGLSSFIMTGFKSNVDSFVNEGSSADHNLNLFHALGKVLYAKRSTADDGDRGALLSHPNTILQKLSVDFDTFNLYLHQNFPLFTELVEEYENISDIFSECDIISQSGFINPQYQNLTSSISAMLSVRSLMELRQNIPRNIKLFQPSNSKYNADNSSFQVGTSKLLSIQKPEIFEAIKLQNYTQRQISSLCNHLRVYGCNYIDSIHYISKIYNNSNCYPPFLSGTDFAKLKSLVSYEKKTVENYSTSLFTGFNPVSANIMEYNPTIDWIPLQDVYYRRHKFYNLTDIGIDLAKCRVAPCSFGGPIAVIRDYEQLVESDEIGIPDGMIIIFNSAGIRIGQIECKGVDIVSLGWCLDESFVTVQADGTVKMIQLSGKTKTFSLGNESQEFGVKELMNELPQSWTIIPPELTLSGHVEILLSIDKTVYSVDISGFHDQYLQQGPFTNMSVSPNGKLVALLQQSGKLKVISSDFQKLFTETYPLAQTDSGKISISDQSLTINTQVSQMAWCGNDGIVVCYDTIAVLVGPFGGVIKFDLDSKTYLAQEVDGLRFFNNQTHDFLQKVPDASVSVFQVGSTSPSALLFDAYDRLKNESSKADEIVRSIGANLSQAIDLCIEAAGNEFNYSLQQNLLRAASFGKNFYPEHNSSKLVNMCTNLRVLNAIREESTGLCVSLYQ